MVILGIDPGTRVIGYSFIEVNKRNIELLEVSSLKISSKLKHTKKLLKIYNFIEELIERGHPDVAVVEDIFLSPNIRASFKMGQARGVILLALEKMNIPIVEYSPREVKQSITGNGNATKSQVQYMVNQIFGKSNLKIDNYDQSDAIAIAYCHYNHLKF